ncbi:MAG: VWA domain-containing protein [Anaerolineae bacterium]|nr:VWA domain-containing protein [Anaerolineae bacterium]
MNQDEVLYAGSDSFIKNMLSLVHLLRRAGMPVSSDQVMDFTRALKLVDIGERAQVYHAARCLLVSRHEHLLLFETIFNTFWNTRADTWRTSPQKTPRAPRHDKQQQPVLMTYMSSKARAGDPELDVIDKSATYSDLEILQRKDFSQMTPDELDAVKRLIQDMRWRACFRQSRRRVASRNGDTLHMRRVMAAAVRNGGVPLALTWQSRKIKQRPIILIADISGSMEKYSRLVLQFFYSLSHSLKHVECFVFGTRLTRISLQLKLKNIDHAVSDAAAEVVDWAGGTRIGESLSVFNHQWSRRVLRRGAIVMIVSDGWERGDAAQLGVQMRYLQLRCYRLIWLNPLIGKVNYQPQVEGMAAALPYIDDFLPIHNLHSLSTLATHLATLSS